MYRALCKHRNEAKNSVIKLKCRATVPAGVPALGMPANHCYFVDKEAAADAAPDLKHFGSIFHRSAVFTQNLGKIQ